MVGHDRTVRKTFQTPIKLSIFSSKLKCNYIIYNNSYFHNKPENQIWWDSSLQLKLLENTYQT